MPSTGGVSSPECSFFLTSVTLFSVTRYQAEFKIAVSVRILKLEFRGWHSEAGIPDFILREGWISGAGFPEQLNTEFQTGLTSLSPLSKVLLHEIPDSSTISGDVTTLKNSIPKSLPATQTHTRGSLTSALRG